MEEKGSQSKKVLWVLLGCLGLVVVFCAAAVIAISAWFIFLNRDPGRSTEDLFQDSVLVEPSTPQPSPSIPPTSTPLPELEPSQVPDDQASAPTDSSPAPDPHAAQRARIEANVAQIRGLEPLKPVVPTLLTMEQLRIRLEEDLLEEYGPEEARADAITLSAFDFIPPDFDLQAFILDLYTEQIAGFYDPENDEFVIISNDDDFGGIEQLTHAHEFVHALQDQHFDLEALEDESLTSEEVFAMQAFVEGEATLVQMQVLESGFFDINDLADLLMDILGSSITLDMEILESAPTVLAHELEFPYLNGMEFVQTIYQQGGYDAVNQVWNNLPTSTEQIIHPERYLSNDQAIGVSLSSIDDVLGPGWKLTDEDTLGEFYLREYLAQQLDGFQVELAATGWGGDQYVVYFNDELNQLVMLLRLAWDSPADQTEFEAAYTGYADGRFGATSDVQPTSGRCWTGEDVICLKSIGEETQIILAPEIGIANLIASTQSQ